MSHCGKLLPCSVVGTVEDAATDEANRSDGGVWSSGKWNAGGISILLLMLMCTDDGATGSLPSESAAEPPSSSTDVPSSDG